MAKRHTPNTRDRVQSRRYSPAEVLERLATIHGLKHEDGTINYSAMSRRTGIAVPTLSRIARGARSAEDTSSSRADSWVLSASTIRRIMSSFSLTFPEASGEAEIPLDTPTRKRRAQARIDAPSVEDLDLLRSLRALSPSDRREVQVLIDIKRQLGAARKRD